MAELLGPDGGSRPIYLAAGKSAHGRTATVYSDAGATTPAAILTYDGTGTPGAAISGSQVTVGADSELPQFWFPSGVDTLYVRVNGMSGVRTIRADFDARLDTVAGMTQGAAVADMGALTVSAPSALTAVAAAGANPTKAEFDALLADVTALRATLAAAVTDLGTARTKLNAELGSLRTAGIIAT